MAVVVPRPADAGTAAQPAEAREGQGVAGTRTESAPHPGLDVGISERSPKRREAHQEMPIAGHREDIQRRLTARAREGRMIGPDVLGVIMGVALTIQPQL